MQIGILIMKIQYRNCSKTKKMSNNIMQQSPRKMKSVCGRDICLPAEMLFTLAKPWKQPKSLPPGG